MSIFELYMSKTKISITLHPSSQSKREGGIKRTFAIQEFHFLQFIPKHDETWGKKWRAGKIQFSHGYGFYISFQESKAVICLRTSQDTVGLGTV